MFAIVLIHIAAFLLVVAGVAGLVMGEPYLVMERGIALMVSGSVALVGGLLLFAAGLCLSKLRGITSLLASLAAPSASLPFVPTRRAPVEREDAVAASSVSAVAAALGTAALTEPDQAEAKGPDFSSAPESLPRAIEEEAAGAKAPFFRQGGFAPAPPPPTEAEADQSSLIERIRENRRARLGEEAPAVEPPPRDEDYREPEADPLPASESAWTQPDAGQPEPGEPPAPSTATQEKVDETKDEAQEPEPAPSGEVGERVVVRTFTSGSGTYTMYSDGTIEAITPQGTLHFSSLDELRDFIDKRSAPTNGK